ncbi:hypothetical protein NMY22_g9218 [Coprinellus aureogranulatus]|nr:hypothetical protein NMY22_g9218 [Coprinellus aureogranulatus]
MSIVTQLIVARKIAPFYRPLEEYEDSWDDDQILAARKELPESSEHGASDIGHGTGRPSSHSKRPGVGKEFRPEAAVYRGAVECPICFLYYPPNINHSRCCDQAICTECFVQIKRAEPTTTHLVSEPAACPYCVQENFGIVYTPPPWRAGIGSEGFPSLGPVDVSRAQQQASVPTHKRRQKSYSADSPEVVTIDQIRPDWEAKLAAVRAAVARRANRRIIMRQVGDRLIPVGIGRIQTPEEAAEGGATPPTGSRRRRHHNGEGGQYVGVSGQDLEELMLMEAMRLSLIDHEEHQRKEAEEKRKKEEAERAAAAQGTSTQALEPSSSTLSTGTHSRSPSRSRTPPVDDSLVNRSPPPFSTLNAAFMSSGTASAFLNSSRPPIVSSSEPPANSQSTGSTTAASSSAHPPSTTSSVPSADSPAGNDSSTKNDGVVGDAPMPDGTTAPRDPTSSS